MKKMFLATLMLLSLVAGYSYYHFKIYQSYVVPARSQLGMPDLSERESYRAYMILFKESDFELLEDTEAKKAMVATGLYKVIQDGDYEQARKLAVAMSKWEE